MIKDDLQEARRLICRRVDSLATKRDSRLPCRNERESRSLFSPTILLCTLTGAILEPFLMLQSSRMVVEATATNDANSYYQRYQSYPPYCADPKEMASRFIPPLPDDDNHIRNLEDITTANSSNASSNHSSSSSRNVTSRLVHVTTIIRHGARTPTNPKPCWEGYWDDPDGIWNCQLNTVLSTRPYNNHDDISKNAGMYLVEKIYDAFQGDPENSPYKNNLNGTCQVGQLIEQGYQQQTMNGRFLRDAYVYDGSSSNPNQDPRLRLFDTTPSTSSQPQIYPFLEPHLRYRSDDDQRTLASGQILLSTMFEPELIAYRTSMGTNPIIVHHTADRPLDILSDRGGCPSHDEVKRQSIESPEFQTFFHSKESQTMRQLLHDEMGIPADGSAGSTFGCIMPAICTDRALPDVINDYGQEKDANDDYTKKYGPHRFERLVNYLIENRTITNRFNDAEWSKLVMAPLWAEIMDHIMPVVQPDVDANNANNAVKFALYSGHDSTIAPLMASLSPKLWNATDFPWYASMMTIEIHEIHSDNVPDYAFRLVYNGRVLTWLIEDCPEYSHLCDFSVLFNRVSKFATRKNGGCQGWNTGGDGGEIITMGTSMSFLFVSHPTALIMTSMVVSFLLGGLFTFFIVQCCWTRPRRQQRIQSEMVLGMDPNSSEFTGEEPDIVID